MGTTLADLTTPALLIDLDKLDHNLRTMARWADGKVSLRPHVKTLKSPAVARRQVELGAIGVTAATVDEALAMADAGISEVLIANQVVQPRELDRLLTGAGPSRVILAVDTDGSAHAAAAAATRTGRDVDLILEVDVGMRRGGVRSAEEAITLASVVDGLPGVRLVGVMGYEGHTVLEPDRETRARNANEAMDYLATVVGALRDSGHDIAIVAAAGTNTHPITGVHPVVTELQVGTYATMDSYYVDHVDGYEVALSVLATVTSVHGDRVLLDAGSKTFGPAGPERLPRPHTPGWTVAGVHEEHLLVDVDPDAPHPAIGDRARFDVQYAGGAALMHRHYTVVQGETVVDTWPIVAGPASRGAQNA